MGLVDFMAGGAAQDLPTLCGDLLCSGDIFVPATIMGS